MAVELATALIWALRIVLPIILFCIYFKLQAPKDDAAYSSSGKHQYSRNTLLAHRKAVEGEPVPASVANISRVDKETAPEFFEKSARPMRGRGGASREDRQDRRERGGRDRRERDGERKERREKDKDKEKEKETPAEQREVAPAPKDEEPEPTKSEAPEKEVAEEKMHLESLLNYVAFKSKDQQRTFLVDEGSAPPPPPPKPPKKTVVTEGQSGTGDGGLAGGEEAKKANDEAQMVLNGAIKYKRVDVAKKLYDQLEEQQVEIYEKTYALMVESCVLAADLKSASDFLMKMEANGHSPDTQLLDKVMDLYSQRKLQKDKSINAKTDSVLGGRTPLKPPSESIANFMPAMTMRALASELAAPDFGPADVDNTGDAAMLSEFDASAEAARTKLSSEATLFVPSFGQAAPNFGFPGFQPPPPPGPPPGKEKKDDTGEATEEVGAEKMQIDLASAVATERTSLKATSKPFQPQGMVTFNPYDYTWTVDNSAAEGQKEEKEKGKGKGKGKGGGKGSKESKTKETKSEEKGGKGKRGEAKGDAKGGDAKGASAKGKAKGKGKEKASKEPEKPEKVEKPSKPQKPTGKDNGKKIWVKKEVANEEA